MVWMQVLEEEGRVVDMVAYGSGFGVVGCLLSGLWGGGDSAVGEACGESHWVMIVSAEELVDAMESLRGCVTVWRRDCMAAKTIGL